MRRIGCLFLIAIAIFLATALAGLSSRRESSPRKSVASSILSPGE